MEVVKMKLRELMRMKLRNLTRMTLRILMIKLRIRLKLKSDFFGSNLPASGCEILPPCIRKCDEGPQSAGYCQTAQGVINSLLKFPSSSGVVCWYFESAFQA